MRRSDAELNCISNIRPAGLSYEDAAYKLIYILNRAPILGGTGLHIKDESDTVDRSSLRLPDARGELYAQLAPAGSPTASMSF